MTEVRASQLARQTLYAGEGRVRKAQLAREVLMDGAGRVRVAQLARQVLRDDEGFVRVAQLSLQVLRSGRDSPYPNFPVRLFKPPSLALHIEAANALGGSPISGDQREGLLEVGGRWVMEFSQTPLWDRDQVLAWRDFVTAADLGVMPVIVPLWDRLHQPFAHSEFTGSTTFGQVVWRDIISWQATEVQASTMAVAQQYATQIDFSFSGGELSGGEHFTIYGPRYGFRLYRIVRIAADVDGVKTAIIRPALREWADAGTPLNFDSPRCTMRIDGDIDATVDRLRFGRGAARFVETFDRYP